MKSALFVDFDNIYSGLRRLDQASADRFACHPMKWMNWVCEFLELPDHVAPGSRRRVLVRRCYLNPQVYQQFRPFFNLAGFEIIDCPALTAGGKTSTDIHMVLDMIDLLQHEAHYDEFIVFSADADFTPVLRKLRRWDRRTTVLAIGFPSAAYRASADLVIDQDEFVRSALGIKELDEAVTRNPVSQTERQCKESLFAVSSGTSDSIVDLIKQEIQASPIPVPCSRIASLVSREFATITADWNGKGTFRKFVEALDLAPLVLEWNSSGGYIHDPQRPPVMIENDDEMQADDWDNEGQVFTIAKQIHEVTGVPLLSPRKYRILFQQIAADVSKDSFHFIESGKRIRDRCRDVGNTVSRADVTFTLRGLLLREHKFEKDNSPAALSRTFMNHVRSLCLREQLMLDQSTENAIHRWISPGT